jgi:hypothetical protein
VRGKWHALRSGTPQGVKPTDNVPTVRSRTDKHRATPATYADKRNLRLKRREFEQVKAAETLDQNGDGVCASLLTHQWGFFHQTPGV